MRIVLSTGGTGGHVFPALSLAEELKVRGYPVTLITDERGARYHDSAAFSQTLCLSLDQGKGRLGKGRQLWSLFKAGLKVLQDFRRQRPNVVVGFGGYTSAPVVLAAVLLRIPIIIHEQNAVLGRVNRWLGRFAKIIAVAFPEVKGGHNLPLKVVGNPVRQVINELAAQPYQLPQGMMRIFVVGGSQGAKILFDVVPQAIAALPQQQRQHLHIVQQCRPENVEAARARYAELQVTATVEPFFVDIASQYALADLIIARSGAMTVAEVAVAGRAALFVPFAAAMDNHQYYNAKNLSGAEAAWLVVEKEFTAAKLSAILSELLAKPELLAERADKVRAFAYPRSASMLADLVEDLLVKK